jgi:hypothetical protein
MARQFKTEYELESRKFWKGCCALRSKMGFDADGGSIDLRNQDFDAMNTSSFRCGYIVSVPNILVDHDP